MKKQCFKCNKVKDIRCFYRHPQMFDGHLNKCKNCTKEDVKNPKYRERIIAYEKKRQYFPERKEAMIKYQQIRRQRFKGIARARAKINNALRSGQIKKSPCEICGIEKVEAHHPDYRSPLKIRWLCRKHHLTIEGKIPY